MGTSVHQNLVTSYAASFYRDWFSFWGEKNPKCFCQDMSTVTDNI